MAREMLKSVPRVGRPKWIVYGYSATAGYVDSVYYDSSALSKALALRAYRQNVALGSFSQWNHPVPSPWTWNDLLPLRKVSTHLPFLMAQKRRDASAGFGRWSVLPQEISSAYLRDDKVLKLLLASEPFKNPWLVGNNFNNCDWTKETSGKAHSAVRSFRELASDVLLFLSPSTGDDLAIAPSCFLPSLVSLLELERSERVRVVADPSSAYSLSYSDFVFGDNMDGPLWIDSIHPNISGARKITANVAEAIRKASLEGRP